MSDLCYLRKPRLFSTFCAEKCMKMKEFGPRGASLDPPMSYFANSFDGLYDVVT